MATYTWDGKTGRISNANNWTPTGTPGASDSAIITAGNPIAVNSANGPTFYLGATAPEPNNPGQPAPTFTLVGYNTAAIDVSDPIAVANERGTYPLDANIVATGNNNLTVNVGNNGPFGSQGCTLDLRSAGKLTGSFTTYDSDLNLTAAGTISGNFGIDSYGQSTINGSATLTNATVLVGSGYEGLTPDSSNGIGNLIVGTRIGPNVTFNMNAVETAPSGSTLEVKNAPDASTVFNLVAQGGAGDWDVLKLDTPITFMRPLEAQINVKTPYALTSNYGGGNIAFTTDDITSAKYTNGTLSLDESGHTANLKISGLDNSGNWLIIQSAPKNGLVTAQLTYGPDYFTNPHNSLVIPPGGNVIHVT